MTYRIDVLLFDGFELLDVFGPVELFTLAEGFECVFHAVVPGPVHSSQGVEVVAPNPLSALRDPDILMVPGGKGTRTLVSDADFLDELVRVAGLATKVTSVCTGSALLAAAGILDGHRATSNKLAFEWATSFGEGIDWDSRARWVEDGRVWTSSGISAGMDMAYALIRDLAGDAVAAEAARRGELIVQTNADADPFVAPGRS